MIICVIWYNIYDYHLGLVIKFSSVPVYILKYIVKEEKER